LPSSPVVLLQEEPAVRETSGTAAAVVRALEAFLQHITGPHVVAFHILHHRRVNLLLQRVLVRAAAVAVREIAGRLCCWRRAAVVFFGIRG